MHSGFKFLCWNKSESPSHQWAYQFFLSLLKCQTRTAEEGKESEQSYQVSLFLWESQGALNLPKPECLLSWRDFIWVRCRQNPLFHQPLIWEGGCRERGKKMSSWEDNGFFFFFFIENTEISFYFYIFYVTKILNVNCLFKQKNDWEVKKYAKSYHPERSQMKILVYFFPIIL